ncbi:MAG: hypothetical protein MHM6MM_004802 [Cercozoa sp. M6MM]
MLGAARNLAWNAMRQRAIVPQVRFARKHAVMDRKRRRLVMEHEAERRMLKAIIANRLLPNELRQHARTKLHMMHPDTSRVRINMHCVETFRARGVSKEFKMCRQQVVQLAKLNQLPGIRKHEPR